MPKNTRGVLKFKGGKLDKQINETFSKMLSAKTCKIFRDIVVYNDQSVINRNPFINANTAKLNHTEQRVQLREYFSKNWNAVFCCKSRAWQSEKEFRWLIHSEEDSPKFIPIDDVVEAVFVKCDFRKNDYPSLCERCKGRGFLLTELIEKTVPRCQPKFIHCKIFVLRKFDLLNQPRYIASLQSQFPIHKPLPFAFINILHGAVII